MYATSGVLKLSLFCQFIFELQTIGKSLVSSPAQCDRPLYAVGRENTGSKIQEHRVRRRVRILSGGVDFSFYAFAYVEQMPVFRKIMADDGIARM